MNINLAFLESRHVVDHEELSDYLSANFGGNMATLRQLQPFIQEIKRRFKILPRNKDVTGEYQTIYGHRSFKSWCRGVLHRSDRAVRYLLAVGHGTSKKKTAETLSALLIRTIEYVKRQRLGKTKTAVLTILKKRLDEEEHAERNPESCNQPSHREKPHAKRKAKRKRSGKKVADR